MRRRGLPLVVLLASLSLPAVASAARVSVVTAPKPRYPPSGTYGAWSGTEAAHYVAGVGERNRLLVTYSEDARVVTLTDPGAVIAVGEGCVSEDEHTARCSVRQGRGKL